MSLWRWICTCAQRNPARERETQSSFRTNSFLTKCCTTPLCWWAERRRRHRRKLTKVKITDIPTKANGMLNTDFGSFILFLCLFAPETWCCSISVPSNCLRFCVNAFYFRFCSFFLSLCISLRAVSFIHCIFISFISRAMAEDMTLRALCDPMTYLMCQLTAATSSVNTIPRPRYNWCQSLAEAS